jgi:hypothetical protein
MRAGLDTNGCRHVVSQRGVTLVGNTCCDHVLLSSVNPRWLNTRRHPLMSTPARMFETYFVASDCISCVAQDSAQKTFLREKSLKVGGRREVTGDQAKAMAGAVHGFSITDQLLSNKGWHLQTHTV